MAASAVRALIILAMLACALVMRSADAADPGTVTVGAKHCSPSNKTCHPGDPQAPENQEEEAISVNVTGGSSGNEAEDVDELPSFDQELIVLGH